MDQFQFLSRPELAHGFDQTETQTAAPMDRQPCRFIDHQQVFVLVQDRGGKLAQAPVRGLARGARLPQA